MKIYWNTQTNSKNIIGKQIKDLRTARRLSQSALAAQMQLAGYELSDLSILRIEHGIRFVPDYEVVGFASFFNVSCDYLLGLAPEHPKSPRKS